MFAFSMRAYSWLAKLWKSKAFDVIHDNQTLGFGILLMQKTFPTPVLTTIHHPLSEDQRADFQMLRSFEHRLRRATYYPLLMHQIVVPRLEKVVTVSNTAAQSVAHAYGIPREKVAVVYNGVDTELFKPDPSVPKKKNQIIFVGNTEDRKKGIRYLLEAMIYLPKDVHLLVVDGAAPRHVVMGELMRRFNIMDRVTTTGKIPTKDLVTAYQESEIAVAPSLYEGFGFPPAEAMSCNVAVVSSDGGALPEVVGKDGETGLIVPKQDARALARSINLLLSNRGLRQKLADNGRQRVLSMFSWDAAAKSMVDLYQELISSKNNSRRKFHFGRTVV
jgi:glycosyltransferase involved in cell wall biosynthesis